MNILKTEFTKNNYLFSVGDFVRILPFNSDNRIVEIDEMERFIGKVGRVMSVDTSFDKDADRYYPSYEVFVGYSTYFFEEDVLELA